MTDRAKAYRSYDKNEKNILPDVEKMLKSFTLKTKEEKKASKTDAGDGK